MYVDPISAALSVLSGEDRGLISRTGAGNRAFPSDDVFLSEHNDFYYDIRSLFCQPALLLQFNERLDTIFHIVAGGICEIQRSND